jgi:hypothetical protein
MLFIVASGLAPNTDAQLAIRSLIGFFGCTPLVCAGVSISDLWNPMERVLAFPVFANAAFTGPVLVPGHGRIHCGEDGAEELAVDRVGYADYEWVGARVGCADVTGDVSADVEMGARYLRRVTGDDRFRAQVEIRLESFPVRL